jgi:hypothetical protein
MQMLKRNNMMLAKRQFYPIQIFSLPAASVPLMHIERASLVSHLRGIKVLIWHVHTPVCAKAGVAKQLCGE